MINTINQINRTFDIFFVFAWFQNRTLLIKSEKVFSPREDLLDFVKTKSQAAREAWGYQWGSGGWKWCNTITNPWGISKNLGPMFPNLPGKTHHLHLIMKSIPLILWDFLGFSEFGDVQIRASPGLPMRDGICLTRQLPMFDFQYVSQTHFNDIDHSKSWITQNLFSMFHQYNSSYN